LFSLTNSSMTFNSNPNLVTISSYPNYRIINNTFSNYQTALSIDESGLGKDCLIESNAIHMNEYGYGIQLYHSNANISGSNIINSNYIGIAGLRNSSIEIIGNDNYPYQMIYNNFNDEMVFSEDSFPNSFKYNLIFDSFQSDNYLLKCVHHVDRILNCSGNFWGEQFRPERDLYPYQFMAYDPVWEPGDSVLIDYNPALELYTSAKYNVQIGNYYLAKLQFKQIIAEYSRTEFAFHAAKALITIEKSIMGNFTELQAYYQSEPNLHYDDRISKLSDYLYNYCNIEKKDYAAAIDWFEGILENPPSLADSIYAVIDIGYTYLLMDADKSVCNYTGRIPHYKPDNTEKYYSDREVLIRKLLESSEEYQTPEYTTQLYGNYPNPFNPSTTIVFSIAFDLNVEMNVYNIKGQRVKTLINDRLKKGTHSVLWNGTDDNGKTVTSGVYLYKIKTNNQTFVNKMLLLK
ncbi:MAG: T9SS type A sorting domain-containing protein, partial [Candidatus Cloacimonetes bacterium]|nr:T9SS type A sorting domain-containing protein [Candidatus Cloacimonadota bacterium]